jgi:flagellar hook protein FlgE
MAMSAISSGISGMQHASARLESSAARVARVGTGLGEVDLAAEMVNVLIAKVDFEAATKVVKAATDMQKHAIDILA